VSLPERRPPDEFPNLLTGELVERANLEQVTGYLEQLMEHRRKVSTLIKEIGSILVDYSREAGTKTIRVGGLKATITGPTVEWDVATMSEGLLEAGLPYERLNELVTIEQTYKVNANVAKSIAASNPKYAEIIEAAKTVPPGPDRVRVTRE
jgi:hypothetical protein